MEARRTTPLRGRSIRAAWFTEFRKNSLWLVPSVCVLGAIVLSNLTIAADRRGGLRDVVDAYFTTDLEDARQVVATVSVAMLTFVGVVFSITLVALQLASTQYSPRVVRSFVRRPATKWTLGIFLATFAFAFNTLAAFESGDPAAGEPFIPAASVAVTYLLVFATLFVFIVFVHRIVQAMRVTYVIEAIATETRRAIVQAQEVAAAFPPVEVPRLGTPTAEVRMQGRTGVIGGIDTRELVRLAHSHGSCYRVPHAVGEFLPYDTVLVEVHGGEPPTWLAVRRCFELGSERTLYQDPAYGIRQLVDIAVRALSPGVNDPTTATQVIDRLVDLLARIAGRAMPAGVYVDDDDVVRLVRPVPTWERFVDLAFTEIRHFGGHLPQVTRRLVAAFEDLERVVPPQRAEPVRRQMELLGRHVGETVHDERAVFALTPDRMGLG